MGSNFDKMAALLDELVNKVDMLEQENGELKKQLQAKTAAAAPAPAPVVPEAVAQATCDALVKAGAITQEQAEITKKAFMENPEVAHKTIEAILYAQSLEKSAATTQQANLTGGMLVGVAPVLSDPYDECFGRMEAILNFY